MNLVAVVAALAVLEYVVILLLTGQARGRFGVAAPATTGHPEFERYFRVQQNTLEQMIVFLPGIFLFANYVSPGFASLLGFGFIVGRILYARGYIADPAKRGTGFIISFVSSLLLLLGGLIGATLAAF
jgi:glutathione S-transferase